MGRCVKQKKIIIIMKNIKHRLRDILINMRSNSYNSPKDIARIRQILFAINMKKVVIPKNYF